MAKRDYTGSQHGGFRRHTKDGKTWKDMEVLHQRCEQAFKAVYGFRPEHVHLNNRTRLDTGNFSISQRYVDDVVKRLHTDTPASPRRTIVLYDVTEDAEVIYGWLEADVAMNSLMAKGDFYLLPQRLLKPAASFPGVGV